MNITKNNINTICKWIFLGILFISSLISSYLLGRDSVKIKTVDKNIKYTTGTISTGKVELPDPFLEVKLPNYILANWNDTIWKDSTVYKVQPIDSAKILEDYLTTRYYNINILNNDTIGKLDIDAQTYMNRLKVLGYTFKPVQKEINTVVQKSISWEVFAGGGVGTNSIGNLQLGIYHNNFGVGYQFMYDLDRTKSYHGLNILYKFNIR